LEKKETIIIFHQSRTRHLSPTISSIAAQRDIGCVVRKNRSLCLYYNPDVGCNL